MGVVRRDGDWRLDKQKDGVYQVTYKKEPQLKIITSDYTPDGFTDARNDFSVPVREVKSFSDAVSLFEDTSRGEPSIGRIPSPISRGEGLGSDISFGEGDDDFPDLPPGGVLLVGFGAGGYLIAQSGFVFESPQFILGGVLLALGIVVASLTYRVYASEGVGAAVDYLISEEKEQSNTTGNSSGRDTPKTPPAPESLKNKLYFERADSQCEWCEEDVDSPDVHHIEPREEGGPNEPNNLIVLCPNCHRTADRGVISRSKLRYKVAAEMGSSKRAD